MKTAVNIILFGTLAVALHLAVFAWRPQAESAASAGDGGADLVAIAAAPESYADMIEQWETPPEVGEAPPPELAAPVEPDLPPPAESSSPDSPDMPQLPAPAVNAPDLPQLPQLDDAPPPPPEPPEPEPEPKPEAKPEPEPAKQPEQKQTPPDPPKSTVQSAPSMQQQAAGSGGGKQAGDRQNAPAATLTKSQRASLLAQWGATIRARIDRAKRAPRGAGAGSVMVAVSVGADGSIRGVSLLRSSGKAALDEAAIAAVKRARKFPAAPKGLPEETFHFRLRVQFR